MTRIAIRSPLAGWVRALADVPDPVFSAGLAGQGVAIDPLDGVLHAPCDGTVVLAGAARHALSVRHDAGFAVLMHVGIDTVALRGEGFELVVTDGQRVAAGEPLLRFELDRVARGAPSVVTPVLVEAECFGVRVDRGVRVGEVLFEIDVATTAAGEAHERRSIASGHFRIPFDHGLHARPAAKVVAALRGLDARVDVHARGREADARSATALMALGVDAGDRVEVIASGPDARKALDALAALLAPDPAESATHDAVPSELAGACAAPGVAIGPAAVLREREWSLPTTHRGLAHERDALGDARATVERELADTDSELSAAHLALLQDPELDRLAQAGLDRGANAARAWRQACAALATRLEQLPDARMRERAADLRDLEARVLRSLLGMPAAPEATLPAGAIVFANEVLPSQFAALQAGAIAGIVTAQGGATSHVALLAAASGVPMLVGAGPAALRVRDGQLVALDAQAGRVLIDPPPARRDALHAHAQSRVARAAADLAACAQPALLRDGTRIAVHANLGAVAEAAPALANGAEGCGLLRTEFLFLERRDAPGEDEQYEAYAAAAAVLGPRPLTIRTLDVGGDKPLAYLPQAREENPALGLRGVRVQLREPGLLRTQLRAILRAAGAGQVRVMVPMINDVTELRAVRAALQEAARELGAVRLPPLGVMIETPAAALLADALAREADFLSIGSNDLSQYVLAMDRGQAAFAQALDAVHPAVLRAIAHVVRAARTSGRGVSVCGGLGSDEESLPLLVGLGLCELSAVPAAVPRVKRVLRGLDLAACQSLAARALDCVDAAGVRALVRAHRRPLHELAGDPA